MQISPEQTLPSALNMTIADLQIEGSAMKERMNQICKKSFGRGI
jgi:hypothetical protein